MTNDGSEPSNGDVTAARAFYGRWARLYDHIATVPGVGSWRERAAHRLDLSTGDVVVEMGCGTGANLAFLRERVGTNGTVVGVDFTRGMLDRAAERVARKGWRNVHLVHGDATAPPVAGPVDGVLASFVVGMLADPAAAVEGWCSLLGPEGRVALLDAATSSRSAVRPLDAAFRSFVTASTPPATKLRYSTPPWETLDERVAAARRPLETGSEYTTDEFALGFVRLDSARIGRQETTTGTADDRTAFGDRLATRPMSQPADTDLAAHHTGITVRDLDTAVEFYRDVLGLPVLTEFTLSDDEFAAAVAVENATGSFAHLDAGGARVELIEYEPEGEEATGGMVNQPGAKHLGLSTDDVDGFYDSLPASVETLSEPRTTGSGSRILFVRDPEGNLVELVES